MEDNLNNSLGKDILNDIIDETGGLIDKINRFILSNNDWIFYFLNPLVNSDANKSIENIVKEFPDEWEDYVDLEIYDRWYQEILMDNSEYTLKENYNEIKSYFANNVESFFDDIPYNEDTDFTNVICGFNEYLDWLMIL